jgi:signal transduction histidine kinase
MSRLVRAFGHLAFGAVAMLAVLFTGEIMVGVFRSVGEPFVSFSLNHEGFVNPVGLEVWGADRAGLRGWDRMVAVDGDLVFGGHDVRQKAFEGGVPRDVVYQVEGLDGSRRFVVIPTRVFSPSDLVRSHASQALLGLAFVVIAVLLYFLRPGTLEAWAFFGFFATVGACLSAVVNETMLWRFPTMYGYLAPFMNLFGLMLVGALSRAFTWKKEGDAAGAVLRRAMWIIALIAFTVSSSIAFAHFLNSGQIHNIIIVERVLYSWLGVGLMVGLSALFIAYRRGKSPRRRARLRQILWAIPVGAGIPTINLFVGSVFDASTISFLWNGFVILLPISTADAIVRHDLLHLNITARRIVGGIFVAAVMGMGLGFVLWTMANVVGVTDASATVALAALLFAVAAPVNHRVQRYVESLLRSRRYDAGRLLAHFTARSSTALHLADVIAVLQATLKDAVEPSRFELYQRDARDDVLIPLVGGTAPIPIDDHLREILERSDSTVFDEDQPAPISLRDAAVSLRLAVANAPVGLLVLGPRSDELAYEGGDIAFVESLAGPLAAALVNTRAYEDVQRLNLALEQRVLERTRELEGKNRELALMNQRKDELVATVSHDFRSPLAIIRQNVQTILRDLTAMEPEDLRSFLEGVARQETRLTSMCTNLLDLARLKQGAQKSVPVDMAEIGKSLVEERRARAQELGLTLSFERVPGAPHVVAGDVDRLQQVLQNLIDNAIKFTPSGGRVSVRLLGERTSEGPALRIEVEDTGCGVAESDLLRLFEPFFQVPRQTHVGQGSGLGLAIVKAVVEAHGGTIEASSEEGRGTIFIIRLPIARERPPTLLSSGDESTMTERDDARLTEETAHDPIANRD